MAVEITDIFAAFALWEQAEMPTFTNIARAANFKAFATFPTPDDIDQTKNGPLEFPYSCHWCEKSTWEQVSIITTTGTPTVGSVEDKHEHVIICALMFGTDGTALHLLSQRDAQWRNAYREGFLRNLHLRIPTIVGPGVASSITAFMGDTTPLQLDLVNADNVGIQTPVTVVIRQKMPVAIGG